MIRQFNSPEEMFEEIRKDREAADSKVKPWQDKIKTGDFTVRVADCFGTPVVIFSKLVDPDYEEDRELYRQSHMKNMRFGWHYSVACTEGEPGDLHVAAVESKITEAMFNEARDNDWSMGVIQTWMARGWVPDFKKN